MSSNQTQTALITGASSGTGFELMHCFSEALHCKLLGRKYNRFQQLYPGFCISITDAEANERR